MPLNPAAKLLWKQIRNPNCTECPLHEEAQAVCLVGDGPVPCDMMIIGEAPGYREDEIERPFAGKAGQLLDRTLAEVGLDRSQIFVTNAAKCRPPDNRTPNKTEIKACRHYLEDELEAVKPKFILTVGNSGLSLIKKSGIMKHRGEVFDFGDAKVLPTVHPAAVLRNPHYEQVWKADVAAFARLVRGEPGATPPKIYLVKDKKTLTACIRATLKAEAVSYDLETSSFDDWKEGEKIGTISISPKVGVAFVTPIHHVEAPWARPERVLGVLARALAYSRRRIAHNAKFDDRWMHGHSGVPINSDFDTMIAAHLLEENRLKGLKPLAQVMLGADAWKDVDLSDGQALTENLKKLALYNGKDSDYTLRLYYLLRAELLKPENRRLLRIFKVLLMPALNVLVQVELNGMWVDPDRLVDRRLKVEKKLRILDKKMKKMVGEGINWNSPQQLAKVMFGQLKLPLLEVTKKGAPSTKESVLLQLRKKHPFPDTLMEYRRWKKNHSSYLVNWSESLDKNNRLHPNYKLTGTVTGRLSSGKEMGRKDRGLNIQQVPRDKFIRSIIGAPLGWKFVEADFSQVELRIAAHYSQDPTMMRYFQLGRDIHMETAMAMLNKPASAVTKEERKKAKAVNFGFLYGMGAKKFVIYARDNYEVEVSLEEAEVVRRRFFETYRALRPWHQRQRRLVRAHKKVQSAIGRVRHLPDIDSQDEDVQAEAERQAINSPVQSLASDLMLLSMVTLHTKMDPKKAKIVGTVHDSILFEVRDDEVDHHVQLIKKTMENLPLKKKFGVQLTVPIVADITVGQHWGEGVEV